MIIHRRKYILVFYLMITPLIVAQCSYPILKPDVGQRPPPSKPEIIKPPVPPPNIPDPSQDTFNPQDIPSSHHESTRILVGGYADVDDKTINRTIYSFFEQEYHKLESSDSADNQLEFYVLGFKSVVIKEKDHWEKLQFSIHFNNDQANIDLSISMSGYWKPSRGSPDEGEYYSMAPEYKTALHEYFTALQKRLRDYLEGK